MATDNTSAQEPDDLDTLSAMWILASNDENPLITYEGIKYRLGLPESYNVNGIVKKHGELFRTIGGSALLRNWKQDMLQGKRLPSWISNIQDEEARQAKIASLTTDDIFRSQFRASDPSRSSLEIIDWGLQHIERLRKAKIEAREEKSKKLTGVWIPLASSVIGLTALLTGAYLQLENIKTQKDLQTLNLRTQSRLKYYEIELKPKLEGYSSIMQHLEEAFKSAQKRDASTLNASLNKLETSYLSIEPFLFGETFDSRKDVKQKLQVLSEIINKLKKEPTNSLNIKVYQADFNKERDSLQSTLFRTLFPLE